MPPAIGRAAPAVPGAEIGIPNGISQLGGLIPLADLINHAAGIEKRMTVRNLEFWQQRLIPMGSFRGAAKRRARNP